MTREWVADPGTFVEANAVVARIDVTDQRLARAEQSARATRAEVNLRSLERELERLRQSGEAVPRFELDQAQSNRDLAAADLQVAQALVAQTDEQLARSSLHAPFADFTRPALVAKKSSPMIWTFPAAERVNERIATASFSANGSSTETIG